MGIAWLFIALAAISLRVEAQQPVKSEKSALASTAEIRFAAACTFDHIPESSGLVYTDGKLWTHEDSGNSPYLFSIDPNTGNTLQTVIIDNFPNVDWEDITADRDFIYVGDFGNNNGNRTDLKVLKIAKSAIGNQATVHVRAEAIQFSYEDQLVVSPDQQTNFDCESLISKDDSLYLFTKDRGDYWTRVYALPKQAGNYKISPKARYNIGSQVCGADYDPVTNQLVLVGYGGHKLNSFLAVFGGFHGSHFFSGQRKKITIGNNYTEWQTEGICFLDSAHLFLSCESTSDVPSSLYELEVKNSEVTAVSQLSDDVFSCYPNPASKFIDLLSAENIQSLALLDLEGRTLLRQSVNTRQYRLTLNPPEIFNGTYLLRVQLPDKVFVRKIVVGNSR